MLILTNPSYGSKAIDIAIALLAPAIASIFSYLVIQSYKKKYENKITELHSSLTKHYFFNKIEHIKSYNISVCFNLENKGKEIIFKEILNKQMELFSKNLYDLAVEITTNPTKYEQPGELKELHVKALNSIYTSLYIFYKWDSNYTTAEKRTLDLVMQKYAKWNIEKYARMEDSIDDICGSMFYHDSTEKTAAIFDSYITALLEQLDNAQKTLCTINGDLKGLKFKGIVV